MPASQPRSASPLSAILTMSNYYFPRHCNTREVVPIQLIIPIRQHRSKIYLTNGIIPIRDITPASRYHSRRPSIATSRSSPSTRHQTTPRDDEPLWINIQITTKPYSHHLPATQPEIFVYEKRGYPRPSSTRHTHPRHPSQPNYRRSHQSSQSVYSSGLAPHSPFQHHYHQYHHFFQPTNASTLPSSQPRPTTQCYLSSLSFTP